MYVPAAGRTVTVTETVTGTEAATEIVTETGIVTKTVTAAVAATPDQCRVLGIIMTAAATIAITEVLRDRISRESEEARPAGVIIIPSRTKCYAGFPALVCQ